MLSYQTRYSHGISNSVEFSLHSCGICHRDLCMFVAAVCGLVSAVQEGHEGKRLHRKGIVWSVCFSVILVFFWGNFLFCILV